MTVAFSTALPELTSRICRRIVRLIHAIGDHDLIDYHNTYRCTISTRIAIGNQQP